MKIDRASKIVMIGDSITEAGRDMERGGEGLFEAYGNGYVNLTLALLMTHYPGERIRFINKGVSGNTVYDLAARWQKDVLDLEPDWVSVMIGINDVWRQFDLPLIGEKHVLKAEYRKTLGRLIESTRPKVEGMVLVSPYYIEPDSNEPMRAMMDEYGAVVKDIAEKYDCIFVDTQAAFNRSLEYYHPSQLAWDRVHPTMTGHMIIACAWLDAIGFKWQAARKSMNT